MLKKLLKLFELTEEEDFDDGSYVQYVEGTIQNFRDKYPTIQMDEVRIPDMGADRELVIKKWFKKDGDEIRNGEILCSLQMGTTRVELESFLDGYLYFRQAPQNPLVRGQVICLFLSKKPE